MTKKLAPLTAKPQHLDTADQSQKHHKLKQIDAFRPAKGSFDMKVSKKRRPTTTYLKLREALCIKRSVLYIGGVSMDCTTDAIVGHCTEHHIRVKECGMIPSGVLVRNQLASQISMTMLLPR